MLTRRQAVSGLILTPLAGIIPPFSTMTLSAEIESDDVVPIEVGEADFGLAWQLVPGTGSIPVAAAPNLPPGFAELFGNVVFRSANDIELYFVNKTGSDFSPWFNNNVAGRLNWKGKKISGPHKDYSQFWDSFFSLRSLNLMEFICYMSVFINEVNGNFSYRSEKYGAKGHPGISYLFDKMEISYPATGRKWRKQSYNTGKLNKNAKYLFNNELFNRFHGDLPLGNKLMGTTDSVWSGGTYPVDRYPTSGNPTESGYILEADFFKFRGRGMIQTTWRENYKRLVEFTQEYRGDNDVIKDFSVRWKDFTADDACTLSSNNDWDRLFGDTSKLIMAKAVQLHAKFGGYLPLSRSTIDINGGKSGSIIAMGDGIGGKGYGSRLKARVVQLCKTLGK